MKYQKSILSCKITHQFSYYLVVLSLFSRYTNPALMCFPWLDWLPDYNYLMEPLLSEFRENSMWKEKQKDFKNQRGRMTPTKQCFPDPQGWYTYDLIHVILMQHWEFICQNDFLIPHKGFLSFKLETIF